jgi:type II secretory ATPase GspE/PulE/Tfp pilus assembly ATPase PilB-like protein/DNA-binding NarL/FixJ family response regulator
MLESSATLPAPNGSDSTRRSDALSQHVLLVDDEPGILHALRRQLHREPYRLSLAQNGDEALAILEQEPVHIVVTDQRMPGMPGAELLERVRERWPDTIRIMLTGYADTAEVMAAIKAGAIYRFILKPVHSDDLRLTLTLALKQHELIRELRAAPLENAPRSKEHEALASRCGTSCSRLPSLLVRHGMLDERLARRVRREQARRQVSMMQALIDVAGMDPREVFGMLLVELRMETTELHTELVPPEATRLLPRALCARHQVLPLRREGRRRLVLAMADPTDQVLLDNLQFVTGMDIEPVLAEFGALQSKLLALYGSSGDESSLGDLAVVLDERDAADTVEVVIDDADDVGSPEVLASAGEPVIRTVNAILCEAADLGASDIHVQPTHSHALVRYRIDGVLVDKFRVPLELHRALVSRVKVLAEMDIAERRRPQDGRITLRLPAKVVDVRISTLPTVTGEKLVLRLLDRNGAIHSVNELGFSAHNLGRVLELLDRPQGIFLTTGPTGSGKTTTLYALLQHNVSQERNYVTIEDPVEYTMPGAAQVAVHERIGLDFASALRSVLRQDPDVILLGEIRDPETASVAFHASMTGHKVYSTLHTNSSVEALSRLYELGLKGHFIATALDGILSQRLVRRICTECREPDRPDPALLARLGRAFRAPGLDTFRGRGCPHCGHTGYRGRAPLHELLVMDEEVIGMISAGRTVVEIGHTLSERGMSLIADDAREKVHQGVTTPAEIMRVLGPASGSSAGYGERRG